jgi:hypothetical protein
VIDGASLQHAKLDSLNSNHQPTSLRCAPGTRLRIAGFLFWRIRMKLIEEFFSGLALRQSSSATSLPASRIRPSVLPDAVRQAANRGWHIFPVSQLAKLTANPDLLIGEATAEIARLEELAAEYPSCDWRVVAGTPSLCILELDGQPGRNAFAALCLEQGECLTLQAQRGDTAWAFFRWPKGLVLRSSAKKLAVGVSMLGNGESRVIPPSGGSFYTNPWAEIEAVPCWLRDLAFETPDTGPQKVLPVPAHFSRHVPCRNRVPFEKPHNGARRNYPVVGRTGCRKGFRISRLR